jgi:hypothetical protein
MIRWNRIRKEAVVDSDTVTLLVWNAAGKQREAAVRIAVVPAEIRKEHLPNKRLDTCESAFITAGDFQVSSICCNINVQFTE